MEFAIDACTDVAFGIDSWRDYFAIVARMVDYPLGNQRSSLPQLCAICLAIDYHSINGLYHYAILDVLARVYVPRS